MGPNNYFFLSRGVLNTRFMRSKNHINKAEMWKIFLIGDLVITGIVFVAMITIRIVIFNHDGWPSFTRNLGNLLRAILLSILWPLGLVQFSEDLEDVRHYYRMRRMERELAELNRRQRERHF